MPSTRGYRTFALPSGILILALSLVVTGLAAYLTNRSIELRNIVNDYIKNQTYDPSNRFEYNSERNLYLNAQARANNLVASSYFSAVIGAWTFVNTLLFLILLLIWGNGDKMQGGGAGRTAVRFLAGPAGWGCLLAVEWITWLAVAAKATQINIFTNDCRFTGKYEGVCKVAPAYGGILWITFFLVSLFCVISLVFALKMPRTLGGFRGGGADPNPQWDSGNNQGYDYGKQSGNMQQAPQPLPYQQYGGPQPMGVHGMQQGPTYAAPHGGMSNTHMMQPAMGTMGTGQM